MLTETRILPFAQVLLDHFLEKSGVSEKVANSLKGDPQRKAFQEALENASAEFAHAHPEWTLGFFDEQFFKTTAAPLLERYLTRGSPLDPAELAEAWADQLNLTGSDREPEVTELTSVAGDFLRLFEDQLLARDEFQQLFDSRAFDHIEQDMTKVVELLKMVVVLQLFQSMTQVQVASDTPATELNGSPKQAPEPPTIHRQPKDEPFLWAIWNFLVLFVRRGGGNVTNFLKSRDADASEPSNDVTTQPCDLFICYEPKIDKDRQLAHDLHDLLTAQGHKVLIDSSMDDWTAREQIERSELLVVLLSQESADSQIVQDRVRHAHESSKLLERPRILPVRIAGEELFPSAIDGYLDPLQYVIWENGADKERVGQQILAAIEGRLPSQPPIQPRSVKAAKKEGVLNGATTQPDSDWLHELEPPGGAVSGQFYIERKADARLKRHVVKKGGSLTTIRAARQTGKTSLLMQAIQHARQNGIKVVNLDMEVVDRASLQTAERFLRYLADYMVWQLKLDRNKVEHWWDAPLGAQDKVTALLENEVLPKQPIMLAMDQVDRLLATDFHSDFFALLRYWYNRRAHDDRWKNFHQILVISTEPDLLIPNGNQSPFNVGLKLDLDDFSEAQVSELHQRHRSPLPEGEILQLMQWFNGHPYLTRQALYMLVAESLSWSELTRIALSEQGPFGNHLRRYQQLLRNKNDLKVGLKQVIEQNRCHDEMTFYHLLRAGLVIGSSHSCTCRCQLYQMYFKDKV